MSEDQYTVEYKTDLHYPFGEVFFKNENPTGEYPIIMTQYNIDEHRNVKCIVFDPIKFNQQQALLGFIKSLHQTHYTEIENFLEINLERSISPNDYLSALKWQLEVNELEREDIKYRRTNYDLPEHIKKERLALEWIKKRINPKTGDVTKARPEHYNLLFLFKNNTEILKSFIKTMEAENLMINGKWNEGTKPKQIRLFILYLENENIIRKTPYRSWIYEIFKEELGYTNTQKSLSNKSEDIDDITRSIMRPFSKK